MMNRRLYISLFLSTLVFLATAAVPQKPDLDEAAHIGVYIYDLKADSVVVEHDSRQAFTPASVMKSLTSATVIRTLGPDFKFSTPVKLIGERDGDTFTGSIVVEASGDPTIDSRHFPQYGGFATHIVEGIKSEGIKKFDGVIEVDESKFKTVGPSGRWQIHDVPFAYGAPFYGFNFSDNVTTLNLKSMSLPAASGMVVERGSTKGSVNLTRGIGSYTLVVDGSGTGSMETPVTDPAYYFINTLVNKMASSGIEVNIRDKSDGLPSQPVTTIYTQESPRAYDICRSLMCRSDNMFADAMLRAVSTQKTLSAALKVVEETWKDAGVNLGPHSMYDGSGLVRNDALTPCGLGRMLAFMADNKDYYSLFPVCGKEGTVKSFLTGTKLAGRMALKSGSMSAVRCYAGYKLDSTGKPTHVVVLMVNNSFKSTAEIKAALQRFLTQVF